MDNESNLIFEQYKTVNEGVFSTNNDEEIFELLSKIDSKTLYDISRANSNKNVILNILKQNIGTTAGIQNTLTTLPNHKLYNYIKKNGDVAVNKIISFVDSHPQIRDNIQKYKQDRQKINSLTEDLGLGPSTPKMIRVTSIGETKPLRKKTEPSTEDEMVYIQAGEKEEGCGCGCGSCNIHDDDYDGELDMARAELLKANEYSAKLFDMIGNLDSLEGWTASKITKAADYLSSVFHYLDYESMEANVEDEQDPNADITA